MRAVVFVLVLVLCGSPGCAGAAAHSASGGRGSPECRKWQNAVCGYAERCGAIEHKDCDPQYQGVVCKSDDSALSCADQLENASCGHANASCDLDAVADPGPARAACEVLINTYCARATDCGAEENREHCLTSPEVAAIPCDDAIAFRLEFDSCIQQLEGLDCATFKLPDLCRSVIVVKAL